MVKEIHKIHTKMFLSDDHFASNGKSKGRNVFKKSHLGEVTLVKYIKEECESVGDFGEGVCEEFTVHGSHIAFITIRFEAGHQMQVIARKSGQRDPRSAVSYHIKQGMLGKQL